MSDDKEARYLRAREVLQGAGWVFDQFVNGEMAKIMKSDPEDMTGREIAYTRARVATEIKLGLMAEVQEYQTDQQMLERKEQRKERQHGRPDIN